MLGFQPLFQGITLHSGMFGWWHKLLSSRKNYKANFSLLHEPRVILSSSEEILFPSPSLVVLRRKPPDQEKNTTNKTHPPPNLFQVGAEVTPASSNIVVYQLTPNNTGLALGGISGCDSVTIGWISNEIDCAGFRIAI